MATNKVTLWNLAVGIVGGNSGGLIQSENEDSDLGDLCRAFWNEALDQSIIFLRPKETKAYVNIAETSDSPEMSDWTYAFDLPADYLDVIRYTDENDREANYPHDIVGEYIFSDVSDCYLYYVHKLDYDDTTKMSVSLRQLAVANLAVMIAPFYKPAMIPTAEAKLAKAEGRSADMDAWGQYEESVTSSADIT